MASKGSPLGIGLSIDFAQLDADLSSVANKIDNVGANSTVKVGTLSGLAGKDGLNTDQLSAQMGRVGVQLANGVSSGVGMANAMLLKMVARMSATLDKLAGVTIASFTRIDAAMRFPFLDSSLSRIHIRLRNIWSGAGKDLNALDTAMGGGFGRIGAKVAKVAKVLFDNLGKQIGEPIEKAVGKIAPAIEKMSDSLKKAFDGLPAAMNRPFATALEEFLGKLRSTLGKTNQAFRAAGEADGKAFMYGVDAAVKPKKVSFVTDPKDIEALKKQAKALQLGEKIKPPPPIAPLPINRGDRRLTKTIAEEIKPPSATAFENFFRGIRRMSKDATAQIQQDFQDVKPIPPKRPEEIKGRVAVPSLGKDFMDVAGKGVGAGVAAAKQGWIAISGAITMARTKLAEFSAAGYTTDAIIKRIGTSFGGWGMLIAIPLGAFIKLGQVVATVSSFIVDMGVLAARALHSMSNFLSSVGSVGKKSFSELYQSHGVFLGSVLGGIKVVNMLARGMWDLVSLKAFRRVGDDATHAKGAVGALTGSVGKLVGSVGRLGVEMLAAFGVVGVVYKVVEFFKSGVKGATELNATVAQSKATFGESFGAVAEQAEKNAKAFHTSKGAQLELASAFGGMAQGAGIAENKSAGLAIQLTQLAVDAGGVGIGLSEIGDAMKTGLSGRAISLKQFAVNIDENTTKAYAWKKGIAKVGSELTMQQTLLARAGQVMQGLSYVQGAMAKGASQAGVQFKMAGGGLHLFAEKIGEILLPGLTAASVGFNELMGGALDLLHAGGPAIQEWSNAGAGFVMDFIKTIKEFGPKVVAGISWAWEEAKKGPLSFVIDGAEKVIGFVKFIPEAIGIAVRNAGTIWEIAKLEVGTFVENAIAYFNTIPANFQIMFPWLQRNWKNILIDIGNMINAFMDNIGKNIKELAMGIWDWLNGKEFKFEFTPLLEGFAATTEKLPDLIKPPLADATEEVGKLWDKIKQNELKRPKFKGEAEGPGGVKTPPILPEDKKSEYKLGGALEAGSKEAFSAIAKGQAGRSSTTDAVKQGVTVQKDMLKVQKEHLEVVKKQRPTPFEAK